MPQVQIIGVYRIEAPEPVHLVELWVRGTEGMFEIGDFTQEVTGQPRSNWQVPYMEQILSAAGDKVVADDFEMRKRPDLWRGDMRIAFFFHYLDMDRPLLTPFDTVQLPPESELPERLAMIQYEQP